MALGLALLLVPPARTREISPPQIEIEAKFVEVTQSNLKDLGFDWLLNYNTSIPRQVIQPGGVSPKAVGTFEVKAPAHLPRTGDIQVLISPQVLGTFLRKTTAERSQPNQLGEPRVTTQSGQMAAINVLRDLPAVLDARPEVSGDGSTIRMKLVPQVSEFTPWSVDAFGTVAFGTVGGSERTTHDVTIKETRLVDEPTTVTVPFGNGNQIVDRQEIRFVATEKTTKRTETVSERRDINRLGDFAGGGGLRVNYKFNRYLGMNVRGEVLGGRDTLGLVTGSVFGEYDGCWPFIPTYSLGGGVLFPRTTPVMDVGLGLKKHINCCFDVFTEAHLITNFGRTTFGEFNVGASFPLGRAPAATTDTGGGAAPEPEPPTLGRIPVIAHLFRKNTGPVEKRDIVIFVTPRLVHPTE